ncbi:protealysin inhibitor emfourin [Salinicola rhizosphaerae]|uniref:Uncharacterized protein n=1 Tax=Salinicola rhizosphaerae TaxID=1443141 RepID=A0ABQ3E8Y7_9GAMM|nr:protealysin inhibitor emfourin [Salinicola rhizosphaerae]GHB28654.1 hypothetical protein GCM10009038_29450 [Salinicola rhizosphaerae]
MSRADCPRLTLGSVVAIAREGGFAAMPGLSRPRRFACRDLTEGQRARLQALIDEIESLGSPGSPGGNDRMVFRITLEDTGETPSWERLVDESLTPKSLNRLWKSGPAALGD